MTRQQATENFAAKQQAAKDAWQAVRANRTDFALDELLRTKALQTDAELKAAYALRTKFAPSI